MQLSAEMMTILMCFSGVMASSLDILSIILYTHHQVGFSCLIMLFFLLNDFSVVFGVIFKLFVNLKQIANNAILTDRCIFSVSDTALLSKRKSKFSQQESNLRPSDY